MKNNFYTRQELAFLNLETTSKEQLFTGKVVPEDILEAKENWERLKPVLMKLFPELRARNGMINSPLLKADNLANYLSDNLTGQVYLKADNLLPVAGSIKARGGIYAVFMEAIELAHAHGFKVKDDFLLLTDASLRELFEKYTLEVGSTGNLALSIGISGRALGFQVKVHMSSDAKEWKKSLLRSKGVEVIEYAGDYEEAITEGRELSRKNSHSIFIDDENSKLLFLGYSTAAFHLQDELTEMINKNLKQSDSPIFLYLPCGVGGAPGGIAYGTKYLYGSQVYPLVVEPLNSPAVTPALWARKDDHLFMVDEVKEQASGHTTVADGLAVKKPSPLILEVAGDLFAGGLTFTDERIMKSLAILSIQEDIKVEPSAAAGVYGPVKIDELLRRNKQEEMAEKAVHIIWLTGGRMLPNEYWESYYHQAPKS
ncbi:MAG: D-serine ammonia-lyase [Bacillota bacterium]